MRSAAWVVATVIGFEAGGIALHSPGAVELGQYPFSWDVPAAALGAVLGAVVGAFTGFLQTRTVSGPRARFVVAGAIAVAATHALADGAPATWGVPLAAALGAVAAASAFVWAARWRAPWAIPLLWLAWWAGWKGGVDAVGTTAALGWYGIVNDHLIIGGVLGLLWGIATSPAVRRFGSRTRASS